MGTPENTGVVSPEQGGTQPHEGETQRERIERLQREWEAEGHSTEEIGERIRAMVEREESPEESEPDEPIPPDDPEGEPERMDVSSMPLCPVCKGMGHVPEQLKPAKDYDRCPDCGGLGIVMTGSLKEDAALLQCSTCVGNGYVSVPPPTDTPTVPQRNW